MPKKRLPRYCLHKPTGQAYVRIDRKLVYLGKHGSVESHERYREELGKWQGKQDEAPRVTIGELTLLYFEFAKGHYQKDGQPTSKLHVIRAAIRALNQQFRNLPAVDLTPRRFKAVRESLIESGNLCRNTINEYMRWIRACVRWAVGEELLKGEQLTELEAVRDLQKGRTMARESEPVQPVSLADVEAVKPLLAHPEQVGFSGVVEYLADTGAGNDAWNSIVNFTPESDGVFSNLTVLTSHGDDAVILGFLGLGNTTVQEAFADGGAGEDTYIGPPPIFLRFPVLNFEIGV